MSAPASSTAAVTNASTTNTQAIGRGTPYRGKLIALSSNASYLKTAKDTPWATNDQGLAIEFPSQPEVIELARSATYIVQPSPYLPDGYHQYVATNPLEIPISFELHSFDRTYCKQGALTLLQIASRLHAFILPISDATVLSQVNKPFSSKGQGTEASKNGNSSTGNTTATATGQSGATNLNPPVTCLLSLIWVGNGMPGICCIGYLKDVRVALGGPFLKGPGDSFNLPSSAKFSFTFVHHPGHNNDFGSIGDPSQSVTVPSEASTGAYATTVRDRLFNTRDLVTIGNYQGLEDASTNTTPDQSSTVVAGPPSSNTTPQPPQLTLLQPSPQLINQGNLMRLNMQAQQSSNTTVNAPPASVSQP